MIHKFIYFLSSTKSPKVLIYEFQNITFDFFSNFPKTLENIDEDYFRNVGVVLSKPHS